MLWPPQNLLGSILRSCLTARLENSRHVARKHRCASALVLSDPVYRGVARDDLAPRGNECERGGGHGAWDAGDAVLFGHGQPDLRVRARDEGRPGRRCADKLPGQ